MIKHIHGWGCDLGFSEEKHRGVEAGSLTVGSTVLLEIFLSFLCHIYSPVKVKYTLSTSIVFKMVSDDNHFNTYVIDHQKVWAKAQVLTVC